MPAKTTARKRGPKPRPRPPVPNTAPFITRLPWTLNEMEVELAERSLRDFLAQAWHVVEPGVEFIPGWHLDAVCDHLQAVTEGYIRNLLILMPPRHSKSTIASVMWPAWEWIRHASRKWLFSSYSSDLAIRDSVKCRRLIQSEWYQSRWGHIYRLTGDQNAKERYENTRGGVRLATSVGGTATGEGGDRIVCDDPHNVKHAESEAIRTATIQWWDQVMSTRTNDPKKSAKVIIMQRSHDSDLAGHLMRSGLYETLLLPAEYEPARRCVTSIGFEDPRKEEGELLHPDRFGEEQIKILKIELGAYGTAAQLQQRPTPKEGGIIKNTWWRYYEKLPDKFDEILQSWDCAFKDLRSSDYVAGQLWGRVGADCYLLHQLRGQYSFTKTQSQVVALSDIAMDTYKAPRSHAKLVEDKANGTAVIDSLKSAIPGLIAVNPEGGKVARLAAVSPMIESGNVYLPRPENCPWVTDYLLEFEYFPYGTHDDQVDATSQALLRLMRHRKRSGMAPIVSTTRSASFPSMSAAQVNPVTGTTQNRYAPVWSGR
jgi:predicted phage terminase large subunit-like protein